MTEERHEQMYAHYAELDRSRVPRELDIRRLYLPPGYTAEKCAYGAAVLCGEELVLVATGSRSEGWIEDEAWSCYADGIRDLIYEQRVAVELTSEEAGEGTR